MIEEIARVRQVYPHLRQKCRPVDSILDQTPVYAVVFKIFQLEITSAGEITMRFIDFINSNPCNHPGYQLNSRNGRNHLLVISSAFGLLSARAWIHRPNQLETGREGQRALRPADGYDLVLHWLAQHYLS